MFTYFTALDNADDAFVQATSEFLKATLDMHRQ